LLDYAVQLLVAVAIAWFTAWATKGKVTPMLRAAILVAVGTLLIFWCVSPFMSFRYVNPDALNGGLR
jgi:hypothetical protein